MNKLIETHCHLDYLKAFPIEEVLEKAQENQVEKIITISVTPDNLQTVLDIAGKHIDVFCTQGIHPHNAKDATDEVLKTIEYNAQKNNKVKAIGEIGLDYYYDNSPREIQREVFKKHMALAVKLDLPVVIHSRDADQDTIEILNEYAPKLKKKGVIHSFTSGEELAKNALDHGFYLGFNGIITFKKAENVRDILKMTPIERILFETDSPFLTPVPHRGEENGPYFLRHIAEFISQFKGVSEKILYEQVYKNSLELFNL